MRGGGVEGREGKIDCNFISEHVIRTSTHWNIHGAVALLHSAWSRGHFTWLQQFDSNLDLLFFFALAIFYFSPSLHWSFINNMVGSILHSSGGKQCTLNSWDLSLLFRSPSYCFLNLSVRVKEGVGYDFEHRFIFQILECKPNKIGQTSAIMGVKNFSLTFWLLK